MRLPINIQVFIIRKHGDSYQYLMLHRHNLNPQFWQSVTGGLEEGEAIEACARREIIEETGVQQFTLRDPGYWRSFEVPASWLSMHGWDKWDLKHNVTKVYIAEIDSNAEIRMDPVEHNKFCWCTFEEAMNLLYWPGDKKALQFVHHWLASSSQM